MVKRKISEADVASALMSLKRARTKKTGSRGKRNPARALSNNKKWVTSQARHIPLGIPINPFPSKLRTTLTYAPAATYWAPASNSAVAQYALNGIFQPEQSGAVFGTGVQPLYFDQMCTSTGPYKQYKVHGWRGKIKIINPTGQYDDTPSTSTRDCWEVIFQQGFELAAEGDSNAELQAAPNIQRFLVPSGIVNGSAGEITIHFNGRTRDFMDSTVDDSSLAGAYNGNPSVTVYGNLGVRSLNSKTITAYVQMTLEYDVEFYGFDSAISA